MTSATVSQPKVTITCPHCGQKNKRSLAWLRRYNRLTCSCGEIVNFAGSPQAPRAASSPKPKPKAKVKAKAKAKVVTKAKPASKLNLKSIFKPAKAEIHCPHCGNRTKKSVEWIKNQASFTCACGFDIRLGTVPIPAKTKKPKSPASRSNASDRPPGGVSLQSLLEQGETIGRLDSQAEKNHL